MNHSPFDNAVTASERSWRSIVVLLAVISLATVLSWQGWAAKFPLGYDALLLQNEAALFLEQGHLPEHGGISTRGGYTPPGIAWLMIPGMATGDIRLHELVGASLTHALTLWGLWLVIGRAADQRTACVAVILYGLSSLGLFFGSSLWPRANPVCYVWMSYFLLQWITRQKAWYLTAAIVMYSIGCYIFMEMAPAAIAFPLVWWKYRPRVNPWAVLAGLVLCFVVWFPYLRFQVERDFYDLRSLIIETKYEDRPKTAHGDFHDPDQRLRTWNRETEAYGAFTRPAAQDQPHSLLKKTFFRLYNIVINIITLPTATSHVWSALATAVGLLTAVVWGYQQWRITSPRFYTALKWLGGLLVIGGVAANPWVAGYFNRRPLDQAESLKVLAFEAALIVLGLALVYTQFLASAFRQAAKLVGRPEGAPQQPALELFWICFLGPWIAVVLLASVIKYCYWSWVMFAGAVALGTTYYPRANGVSRGRVMLFEGLVLLSVLANPVLIQRVSAWINEGFAGQPDNMMLAIAAAVDDHDRAGAGPEIALGYLLPFNGYELNDDNYRIGSPQDVYLRYRHLKTNSTTADQGYSPDDQYRIVQVGAPSPNKPHRFEFADQDRFVLLEKFGNLEVWKRK